MDRGELAAWKELYALAAGDAALGRRMLAVIRRVPLPYPSFWLAALASLGETFASRARSFFSSSGEAGLFL